MRATREQIIIRQILTTLRMQLNMLFWISLIFMGGIFKSLNYTFKYFIKNAYISLENLYTVMIQMKESHLKIFHRPQACEKSS